MYACARGSLESLSGGPLLPMAFWRCAAGGCLVASVLASARARASLRFATTSRSPPRAASAMHLTEERGSRERARKEVWRRGVAPR
eukprot:1572814-Pyramimonas_sp.AAC.1